MKNTPQQRRLDNAMRLCLKLEKSGYTHQDFSALKEAARLHGKWLREAARTKKAQS